MGAKSGYGGGNLGEVAAMAWAEAHGGARTWDIHAYNKYAWTWACL